MAEASAGAADGYVVGTGTSHSLRELVELTFRHAEIEDREGCLAIDEKLFRPEEVTNLVADSSKARRVLGWQPKVTFEELVAMMVRSDLEQEALTGIEKPEERSIGESPSPLGGAAQLRERRAT